MSTVNKIILVGNVGKDPEVVAVGSSTKASFSVATTESWKDKSTGEWVNETEWHDIIAWGVTADNVGKIIKKGSKVYVEGTLKTEKWNDKTTGLEKSKKVVKLTTFQALDKLEKGDGNASAAPVQRQQAQQSYQAPAQNQSVAVGDDDIPF